MLSSLRPLPAIFKMVKTAEIGPGDQKIRSLQKKAWLPFQKERKGKKERKIRKEN